MIIARKSIAVGFLYSICLIVGVFFICLGMYQTYLLIAGIITDIISLIILIDYFRVPYAPISINEKSILLPKNTVLSLNDILDVSYRRASAKGIQYRWGTIVISSTMGTYKYRYISDCEDVAKDLLRMVYEEKFKHSNIDSK